MTARERILVFRGGAIGDFIVTLPALAALRTRWPRAYIELVAHERIAGLARVGGMVNTVRSLEAAEHSRLFARGVLPDSYRDWIGSFDPVISYLHDPDGVVEANLHAGCSGRVVCGSPIVTERHAVDQLLLPLAALGVEVHGAVPALRLGEGHLAAGCRQVGRYGEHVFALHPGSGSARKNWPLDRFLAVAEHLASTGATPLFITGEAEDAYMHRLAGHHVLHAASLLEVAEVLAACEGMLGNDSGVAHLAAAVGTPTIVLFGPTDPALWAPRGARVIRAHDSSMASISVETVWAYIAAGRK